MTGLVDRHRSLSGLLAELREHRYNGTVILHGTPGGRVHLREGRIGAVTTPDSPGADVILRTAGHADEEALAAIDARVVSAEGAADSRLLERGLPDRREFEVACASAVFDGAFALELGILRGWEVTESVPLPWMGTCFTPRRVVTETARRMAVLTDLWGASPRVLAGTFVRPAPRLPARIPYRYRVLLEAADGSRTARDVAFTVGRGIYAVMLDLARMSELGLLMRDTPAPLELPRTAPRCAPSTQDGSIPVVTGAGLPRRIPGTHRPCKALGR